VDVTPGASQWRGATRDFSSLGVASLVNGLAAYGFATTATHAFGTADAAPVVALWTIWLVVTAALTFPIQHWIVLRGAERRVPTRMLAVTTVAAAVVVGAGSFAFRHLFFDARSIAYPLIAAGIALGSVPIGVCRGRLIALGHVSRTAMILAVENIIRLVAGLCVVALDGSVAAFSATILTGYLVLVAYPRRQASASSDADGDASFREAVRSVGLVGASTLVAQLVLTGGPLVVAASGASSTIVTATFATLAVARLAYLATVGASLRFTAALAELRDAAALRRIGWGVSAGGFALVPVAALAAAVVGPELIGVLFGKGSELPTSSTVLIAVGSVLAVTSLLLLLVAFAAGRAPLVFATWMVAATVGVVVYAALFGLDPELRFATTFAIVEFLAAIGMWRVTTTIAEDRTGAGADATAPSQLDSFGA
jgi:hypothetical protein